MKKQFILILTLPLILASCQNGGNSSKTSSSSDDDDESSSASTGKISYTVTASMQPILDQIIYARNSFGGSIDADTLVNEAKFSNNSILKNDYDTVMRLLKAAFSSLMESKAKVGFRNYGGYFEQPETKHAYNDSATEAINWFISYGLWGGDSYYGNVDVTLDQAKTLLQRIFAYLGGSPKNDYFTYANEDWLFDSSNSSKWTDDYFTQHMVDEDNIRKFYTSFLNSQSSKLYSDFTSSTGFTFLKEYADKIVNSTTSNFWENVNSVASSTGSYIFSFGGATKSSGTSNGFGIELTADEFKAFLDSATKNIEALTSFYQAFGYDADKASALAVSLVEAYGGFPSSIEGISGNLGNGLEAYIKAQIGDNNTYNPADPGALLIGAYLAEEVTSNNIDCFKALLLANLGYSYAALLPSALIKSLGLDSSSGEEGNFLKLTSTALQDYFINSYYSSDNGKKSIAKAESLGKEICNLIINRLSTNNWLSSNGQQAVTKKLNKLNFVVSGFDSSNTAFPISVDASSLEKALQTGLTSHWSAIRNESKTITNVGTFNNRYTNLFLPNAFYDGVTNSVCITTALLVCYGSDLALASDETVYGPFTTVLGHEITHSIDSSGVERDENGDPAEGGSILNETDTTAYLALQEKEKKLHVYETFPGVLQDSDRTLAEDIADIGGLTIAEQIYSKSAKSVDWEKYYKAVAKGYYTNCSYSSWAATYYEDTHSFGKPRVDALFSNSSNFASHYKLSDKDGMYVAPSDRVVVW